MCLSAFVFTVEAKLTVTLLKIQWDSTWDNKLRSDDVKWAFIYYNSSIVCSVDLGVLFMVIVIINNKCDLFI